jgi:hypothetical protein
MDLKEAIKRAIPTIKDDDIRGPYVKDGKRYCCEVENVPNSRQIRSELNQKIKEEIEKERGFYATLVSSVKIGDKNYSSKARVVKITDAETKGNVIGVVKLTPKPKLVLTPKLFGVTKDSGPSDVGSYLTLPVMINLIKNKLDSLVEEERITVVLSEWTKATLDYFDPFNASNSSTQVTNSWQPGLDDEISSEMLELFCAIAYVKFLIRNQTGPNVSIQSRERDRVLDMMGSNSIPSQASAFRVWYPGASNYPIIDCQVGYFEGNLLKAVFPISTKNVTGGREPNVIKFVDVFKDKKQVTSWYKNLPKEILKEQEFQARVSYSAIESKGTLYPAAAAEKLLKSPKTKNKFYAELKSYGQFRNDLNMTGLLAIANKTASNSRNRKKNLDDISLGNNKRLAKKLVCVLLKKTAGTGSPYKDLWKAGSQFNIGQNGENDLSLMDESKWNQKVKSTNRRLNYPFTVENLSLFFEKVLESSSVFKKDDGINFDQVIERAYFTGNKVMISKYKGEIISGAGEVILAKVDINTNTGLVRINFDTSKNLKPDRKYGLRSKNSLNNLQDALGITP